MSTVVIEIAGGDVTDDVFVTGASFTSLVNGTPGQANLRVKDAAQIYEFTPGSTLTLDIDGVRVWGGYVIGAKKVYPLAVMDTASPPGVTRTWEIIGVDYNILFSKRIIFDAADPTGKLNFSYDADTYDDTIINDIFDNYLDIDDDGLTRNGVQRIAKAILDAPGETHGGPAALAGYTWKQMMDSVQRATGGIYYLDAAKDLKYADVETTTASARLTDRRPASYADVVAADAPVAWYRLSEASGPTIDTSGGLSGTVNGDIGYGLEGVIGDGAYEWPTVGTAYIDVPDQAQLDLGNGPLTIEAWIFSSSSGGLPIVDKGDGAYLFMVADRALIFGRSGQALLAESTALIPLDTWTHVALTYDGGNSNFRFYIDGVADPDDFVNPNLVDNEESLLIGQRYVDTGGLGVQFRGAMDEVAIYDRALSASEIQSHYEAGEAVVGYQSFGLLENGSDLVNDMLVWGAGAGSTNYVFSRSQDAASISEHGRWQLSLVTSGLYRQASTDIVAASYVNGTPQSHRGGKDDALTFSARVFRPAFRAGQVVDVTNDIFGFQDALPIRRMTTTFVHPAVPVFDLVLSHAIDQPVSLFEFPRLRTPRVDIPITRLPSPTSTLLPGEYELPWSHHLPGPVFSEITEADGDFVANHNSASLGNANPVYVSLFQGATYRVNYTAYRPPWASPGWVYPPHAPLATGASLQGGLAQPGAATIGDSRFEFGTSLVLGEAVFVAPADMDVGLNIRASHFFYVNLAGCSASASVWYMGGPDRRFQYLLLPPYGPHYDWLIGGSGVTYVTVWHFVALSTEVYVNGLRQRRGQDYTEGSDLQSIVFDPPIESPVGQVWVYYWANG